MHELGLCQSVLAAVEQRAGGRRVTGVRLRVGALHRVFPDAFDQAFSLISAGSVADGADVDLVVVPVRGSCAACGQEWDAADQLPLCPGCGSTTGVNLSGGDELVLESLELESR